ncbi:polysaccharide biosynthesis protein [Flavobacteriaceae bacterium]|jgi:UDP-glucose 4-epimerase|nr:polysaccharide biosynthesis protein [Flavobacteriaceae bacterium]|tara:strand:- start:4879 stop:5862 length:984 start_codon:yes stop_codon:yes gene_type:complete
MFKNKILLITGGTGSFGNAVLNKFIDSNIDEIRIFSRDEKKQDDMRRKFQNDKIKYFIGDVRDESSIDQAMKGVDFVFHAAALKQVPSCEFYPMEAVKTNIIGTENMLNSAIKNNVEKVICLSTDKAVYPINAMGVSKSLMEKVFVAKSRISSKIKIIGTRYGNVMASRGSVIPLFYDQIKNNNPITITDPNMTRFMMSLDNAVELVLYAFKNGNTGDIFVQKAPSTTIGELAEIMKTIFNSNTKIKNIGIRHGEKIHETLLSQEERIVSEDLGNYFRIPADNRDLNYDKYFSKGVKAPKSGEFNSFNTRRLEKQELINLLASIGYK